MDLLVQLFVFAKIKISQNTVIFVLFVGIAKKYLLENVDKKRLHIIKNSYLATSIAKMFNDFPNRQYVNYSSGNKSSADRIKLYEISNATYLEIKNFL